MNIPKGFRLVPVDLTEEMLAAAFNAPLPLVYIDSMKAQADLTNRTGYKAMLAAAPTPPQPIYDEANERELFNAWYGELPTTKLKETMWMAWEACAQSRAKAGEDE